MSSAHKLIEAMRRHPMDWRIDQLQTVASKLGIEIRATGGSHHVFSHPRVSDVVCVPARRPIKPAYIRQFVALCDHLLESTP